MKLNLTLPSEKVLSCVTNKIDNSADRCAIPSHTVIQIYLAKKSQPTVNADKGNLCC